MSNPNIVVDRDALQTLINYASDEIDTRQSCLKDAGQDRAALEQELVDGQEILAAFRAILDGRKRTPHLRRPFHQATDGVTGLQRALNIAMLEKDHGLLVKITLLTEALDALRQYMDKQYIWD